MFHNSLRIYLFKNGTFKNIKRVQEFRHFSASSHDKTPSNFVAIKLENKRLLRVSGTESFIYLQSLLTNDMRQLLPLDRLRVDSENNKNVFREIYALNQPVMYSFICSAVGKVLCDLFVYRSRYRAEDGEYILEVDASIATAVKRLLLGYNLSRNVRVELADDFDLWTVIPEENFSTAHRNFSTENESTALIEIDSDDIKLVSDPRIPANNFLGYRFLTRLGAKKMEDFGKYCKLVNSKTHRLRLKEGTIRDYNRLRYRYGISEGIQDSLSGFYFPFELNGDILSAVSLNKGLYTSEEKIIKIYSDKGIKQRIFPVMFVDSPRKVEHFSPAPRTILTTMDNKVFGELRQRIGRYGIANLWVTKHQLFDISKKLPLLKHQDSDLKVRAFVPFWWPSNIKERQLPVPNYPRCLFNTGIADTINLLEDESSFNQTKQIAQ